MLHHYELTFIFSVEGRMEIVFSLSPYLLKQIFNAVPLIKPLIICRFR